MVVSFVLTPQTCGVNTLPIRCNFITSCNIQTGDIQFDPYWAEQFGHTDADVLPTLSYWESLIHPDDQPKAREKLMANLEGKTELFENEHRLRNREGIWRWFHAFGGGIKISVRKEKVRP